MIPKERALDPFVLSIDIGSSSVRTVVLDRLARPIEGTDWKGTVVLHTEPDGTAVMDPLAIRRAVYEGIDQSMRSTAENASGIAAVGMCTYVSNLIGVDAAYQPLTPVITYADSRASSDAEMLRQDLDETVIHQRTGCRFHTSYWTARFRWLKRMRTEIFKPGTRWTTIGDFLFQDLFGESAASYSVASWTGLLDRVKLTWDERLLEVLSISKGQLPELVDSDDEFHGLRDEFAQRWPALSRIPWYPAVGDGVTANLGSGCVHTAKAALTMGTSAAVRVVVPGKVDRVPDGLWCYKVDADHELLGGAMSEGGNIYAWLKDVLRFDESAISMRISKARPDQHGLTFLPLLAGERAPGWDGSARGSIHGLSLATEPLDIVVAGLEGVAYRLGLVFDLLAPHLDDGVEIIASGGALTNSPDWLQIITDVLGKTVTVSGVAEASVRGTGMIALKNIGVVSSFDDFDFPRGRKFEPRSEYYDIYRGAMDRQQTLYQRVASTRSVNTGENNDKK